MATSPQQLDRYLQRQESPLAGLGQVFVAAGQRYGVDPRLLVAISGAESEFGKKIKAGTNNPFGWGPHIPFGSFPEAIDAVARGLRKGYLDEGRRSIPQIGAKWAPIGAGNDPTNLNSNWSRNVSRFYRELGGSGGVAKAPGTASPPVLGSPFAPAAALASGSRLANPALLTLLERNQALVGLPPIPLAALAQHKLQLEAPTLTSEIGSSPFAPAAGAPTKGLSPGQTLDQILASFKLSDQVTSGDRPGAVTARGTPSDHGRKGKARDVNPGAPSFTELGAYARANPSAFKDFIYAGLPWFIDEGRLYPISKLNRTDLDNHRDHAHISTR